MSKSKIEWTERTWNPTRGCSPVSEGCRNCFAERMAARFSTGELKRIKGTLAFNHDGPFTGFATMTPSGPRWTGRVELIPEKLEEPLHWRKPSLVFVNSMSDLFHEALPDEAIDRVFAVMALCPQHTFQVLTKRSERMRDYWNARGLPRRIADAVIATADSLRMKTTGIPRPAAIAEGVAGGWRLPLFNVWLGVSVEDQATADERIPVLLQTPAALRFVSYEPALGPVDFRKFLPRANRAENPCGVEARHGIRNEKIGCPSCDSGIDWVICGGESGPRARPMHLDWARSVRDQCAAAGVPFFFKQWGEYGIPTQMSERELENWDFDPDHEDRLMRVGKKAAGRLLDGRTWDDMPENRA